MFKFIKKLIKVIAIIVTALFAFVMLMALISDPSDDTTVQATVETTVVETVTTPAVREIAYGSDEDLRLVAELREVCAMHYSEVRSINVSTPRAIAKRINREAKECTDAFYNDKNVTVKY